MFGRRREKTPKPAPEWTRQKMLALLIGAGVVGLIAAAAAFAVFPVLFAMLRSPILRFILAMIFAAPAALAGYALVHGVTHEAIPSAIWRQIFCFIGGALVGVSALMRLAGSKTPAAW